MNTNMHPSCFIAPPTAIYHTKIQSLVGSMSTLGYRGEPILLLHPDQAEYYALTGAHRIHAALQLNLEIPVHILDVRNHGNEPDDRCDVCPALEECVVSQLLDATTSEERLALLIDHIPLATEAIHIMQLEVSHDLFNQQN